MAQKGTKEKLIELKQLAKQAGANIFMRCRLATEILADTDYIAATWGDEGAALDAMTSEYFSDLRGYVSLGRLRQLYQAYPMEKSWQELRYDLAAMEAKYEEGHAEDKEGLQGHRTSYKKIAERLQDEMDQVKADKQRASQEANTATATVAELREKIRDLERENAELTGRISELERMLNRSGAMSSAA